MTSLTRRDALGLFACAALAGAARAAVPVPGDSVYQLHLRLVDQDGHPFDWGSTRGAPVLASMFYTSCEMVCPLIFESIRRTVDAFDKPVRDKVRVVMVSFDPQRDTVPVLKETAARLKGKPGAEEELYKHLTTNPKVKIDGQEEEHPNLKTKNEAEIRNVVQWILAQ